MSTDHTLAVIILHWKDVQRTKTLLDKVLDWNQVSFRIFLIQNESTNDAFVQYNNPQITKVFSAANLGFGGGNNLALQHDEMLSHTHALLINTDAEIEEKEVKKLWDHAIGDQHIFSIGPILEETYQGTKKEYIGGRNIAEYNHTRIEKTNGENKEKLALEVDVFYNIGAVILLNNDLLKKVGYFDEEYFFSGEMADLCYRATKMGYRCITLTHAIATHTIEDSPLRSTLYRYYSLRNRFLFIRKHRLSLSLYFKWLKTLILEIAYATKIRDKESAKMLKLCLYHVLFKISGNQNRHFLD